MTRPHFLYVFLRDEHHDEFSIAGELVVESLDLVLSPQVNGFRSVVERLDSASSEMLRNISNIRALFSGKGQRDFIFWI